MVIIVIAMAMANLNSLDNGLDGGHDGLEFKIYAASCGFGFYESTAKI